MTLGYIFDYGGTLDTGGCHWGKVFWHAYQQAGVPITEAQFREAYVHAERTLGRNPIIRPDFTFHHTLETKLRLQLDHLSNQNCPLSTFHSSLLSSLYAQTAAHIAHSRDILRHIAAPKVLVSNFYGNISNVLSEFGLDGLFLDVIESAVVGIRKPDPRIFALGVEALGLKPEQVVVVGDSIDKDILPAKQAGCQTVWYKGEGWTDDPVDETLPDRIITDLQQLL